MITSTPAATSAATRSAVSAPVLAEEAAPDGADWESELNEAGEAADSPDAAGEDDTRPDLRPVEPDPIDEGETGGNA